MTKKSKTVITFIVSFIIAFFIVGYLTNTVFRQISWIEGATVWQKFKEYYIRTFSSHSVPAFVIALIPTVIIGLLGKKNKPA